MKWLEETRKVAIADIPKPDNWDAVLAEERTKWLSVDFKRTQGPVSLPVLHAATLTIITGTHRIAGMVLGGETHVTCRLFSGDQDEAEFARCSDNAVPPREDYDAWLDRRVKALAALIERQRAISGHPDQQLRGAPKKATTEAREIVAKEQNATPEAVRSAQRRANAPKLEVSPPSGERYEEPNGESPPKPKSIPSRLREAKGQLHEVVTILVNAVTEMGALSRRYGTEDGRWAVLGSVAKAEASAEAALSDLEKALKFTSRIDAAVHGNNRTDRPVGLTDVREGREAYERTTRKQQHTGRIA